MGIKDIKIGKCNMEIVDAKLEELNLSANGSQKVRVERLAKYYEQHSDEIDLANCSNCGADGDASVTACPFCGDEDEVAEDIAQGSESEDEGFTPAGDEDEESEPDADEDDDEDDETEEAEEAEDEAVTEVVEETMAAAEVIEEQAPPKGKKNAKTTANGKTNGKHAGTAEAGEKPVKPKGRKAAAPDVVEATGIVVVDSTQLDEQVKILHDEQTSGAVSLLRIGQAAKKIVEENLWKQRANDKGVPSYRSFKQFCTAEIGMTASHIYREITVADRFTEEDLQELSGRQVRFLLEVPKEDQAEVLEAAKRGESGGKLSDRAKSLRGGDKKKDLPEPKKAITAALALGHTKVKMYKRPTTNAKVGDTEDATPAKRLADLPWGVMDLSNKVRLMLRLSSNANGQIIADVEFRRQEV